MKAVLFLTFLCVCFGALKSQEWVQGQWVTQTLSYFGTPSASVTIGYTLDNQEDMTKWYPDGDGYTDEVKGWEDEERLYLLFTVTHTEALPLAADEVVHCLACLNVDENSELRDGDSGFAACYKTSTGNLIDATGKY